MIGILIRPFIVHKLLSAEVDVVATERLKGAIGIASIKEFRSPVMQMFAPASIRGLSLGIECTRLARGRPVTRMSVRFERVGVRSCGVTDGNGNSNGVVGEEGRDMLERSAIEPFGWARCGGGLGRALSIGILNVTRAGRCGVEAGGGSGGGSGGGRGAVWAGVVLAVARYTAADGWI